MIYKDIYYQEARDEEAEKELAARIELAFLDHTDDDDDWIFLDDWAEYIDSPSDFEDCKIRRFGPSLSYYVDRAESSEKTHGAVQEKDYMYWLQDDDLEIYWKGLVCMTSAREEQEEMIRDGVFSTILEK